MAAIGCFIPDNDGSKWQQTSEAPYLRTHDSVLAVQLPEGCHGYVNGLAILGGIQVVRTGDLVRICEAGRPPVVYVVGRALPHPEPGRGRACRFTGQPISGPAVVCCCGAEASKEP